MSFVNGVRPSPNVSIGGLTIPWRRVGKAFAGVVLIAAGAFTVARYCRTDRSPVVPFFALLEDEMATGRRRGKSKPPAVLIVEDDADVRVLAESIVGDDGYQTLSAASGREALALLEQGMAVAVLFTDINLPDGLDGVELARRVIELHPGLSIIYTTGGSQTDGLDALLVEGAIFLPKPYTRDQLLAALKQQIGDARSA